MNLKKKALLYNLILFDFILLETSLKRISNFFLEKMNKNNKLFRLSLFDTNKAFKKFIKMYRYINSVNKYLKRKSNINTKNVIHIITTQEYIFDFFLIFFKKYHMDSFFKLYYEPVALCNNLSLNCVLFLDQNILKREFFFYFYQKLYFFQSIAFLDVFDFFSFNIFATLSDYKKLNFLGLLFYSIFK